MSSDVWTIHRLQDVALNGAAGIVDGPFGSNLPASAYTKFGVPVIRGSNLTKGEKRFNSNEFVYVTEETAENLSRSICIARDIIFTKKGTLGQVGIIPDGEHAKYLLSSNQMRFRADERLADSNFLYYFLSQSSSIDKIIRDSEHTGVPKINLAYIKNFPVPLPSLEKQKNIANFLSLFDNRITLLREANVTLESIAQALFKSWFVDFDPVRAKMEGRQPEGMDEETAALFPDSFEESELGMVPKNWNCSTVGQSFILTMGQSPPGDTFNTTEEGIPFYQGRTDFGFRFPSKRMFCTKPSRFAHAGDTLVSVRAPVGDVNMAIEKCCIGRGIASIRHPLNYRGYTFYTMKGLEKKFQTYDSEGTVFGSINKNDFQALTVVNPDTDILCAFDAISSPIDTQIVENEVNIRTLTTLRDTLLPRLISGQLRLPEAEALVEQNI